MLARLLARLLLARVELLLQIAERLIAQILLFAQRVLQVLHRLLARRARPVACAVVLGDAQVLHQLVELVHQLCRFGHAALFHQLLDAVHQRLDLVLRDAHRVLLGALRLVRPAFAAFRILRQHVQVIIRRLAQFLHQLGDLGIAGAIAHRL